MQQYDHDRGELSDVWINLKDMHRDTIFKIEVKGVEMANEDIGVGKGTH